MDDFAVSDGAVVALNNDETGCGVLCEGDVARAGKFAVGGGVCAGEFSVVRGVNHGVIRKVHCTVPYFDGVVESIGEVVG